MKHKKILIGTMVLTVAVAAALSMTTVNAYPQWRTSGFGSVMMSDQEYSAYKDLDADFDGYLVQAVEPQPTDYDIPNTVHWSFDTLEGGTVTDSTYAGKTQILVLFKADTENFSSQIVVSNIIYNDWRSDTDIQVTAVGFGGSGESVQTVKENVEEFRSQYQYVSQDKITFCYAPYDKCRDIVTGFNALIGDADYDVDYDNPFSYVFDSDGNLRGCHSYCSMSVFFKDILWRMGVFEYIPEWYAHTVDGGTVNDLTYGDMTHVVVLFDPKGTDPESNGLILNLIQSKCISGEDVHVVAVGCGEYGESEETVKAQVEQFMATYAPDCDDIEFCYATYFEGIDIFLFLDNPSYFDSDDGMTYPKSYIIDKYNNLRYAWEGVYDEEAYTEALNSLYTLSWSVDAVDGGTVTTRTYAGKTQVWVLFRPSGVCWNSNETIEALAKSTWIKDEDVQVIAVGCGDNYSDDKNTVLKKTETFIQKYTPNCNDIRFCYATANECMDMVETFYQITGQDTSFISIYYAENFIIDGNGDVAYRWAGTYDKKSYTDALLSLGAIDLTGDINGDTKVNDKDVVALARYVAGWGNDIELSVADMDGNGKVNDKDVVMLARRVAGWNV